MQPAVDAGVPRQPRIRRAGSNLGLEDWSRRRSTTQALALRARIVVACAEGAATSPSPRQWSPIRAGDREVDVLPPPAKHAGFDPVLGPVARLGEHTKAVLAEFGLTARLAGESRSQPGRAGRQSRAASCRSEHRFG